MRTASRRGSTWLWLVPLLLELFVFTLGVGARPRDALRAASRRRPALGARRPAPLLRVADHLPGRLPAAVGAADRVRQPVRAGDAGRRASIVLYPDVPGNTITVDHGVRLVRPADPVSVAALILVFGLVSLPARVAVVRGARVSRGATTRSRSADVSKAFRLPHQQRTTIKEHFLHPLQPVDLRAAAGAGATSASRSSRGEFFGIIGAERQRQEHAAQDPRRHLPPGRAARSRVTGALSPFIELGVGFNPELNARDNIRINGTLLGLTRSELDERFDEIVAFAELERFVDQKLKNYSSGMQVRLAYSIAIQVDFDILLLDEVLAVGDQAFQEKCFATFERLPREGKTIVFVSHDLDSVGRFCDRALYLRAAATRRRSGRRTTSSISTVGPRRRAPRRPSPSRTRRHVDRRITSASPSVTRRL